MRLKEKAQEFKEKFRGQNLKFISQDPERASEEVSPPNFWKEQPPGLARFEDIFKNPNPIDEHDNGAKREKAEEYNAPVG